MSIPAVRAPVGTSKSPQFVLLAPPSDCEVKVGHIRTLKPVLASLSASYIVCQRSHLTVLRSDSLRLDGFRGAGHDAIRLILDPVWSGQQQRT